MQVLLKHDGFLRVDAENDRYVHTYNAFADSGWAGPFRDESFVRDGWYELPDDMFALDSAEVKWQCDSCGHTFSARTRPGGVVRCPLCSEEARVPEDAVLVTEDDDEF